MALSGKSLDTLYMRGIVVERDTIGPVINISTLGVAWVLNFLAIKLKRSGALKLTSAALQALAQFNPNTDELRPLSIRKATLPVRETHEYPLYCFYLEKSPPTQVNVFHLDNQDEGNRFPIDSGLLKCIAPAHSEQGIYLVFSDDERRAFDSGKLVQRIIAKW